MGIGIASTFINGAFPDIRGLSPRNLKYMQKFAREFNEAEFVQQAEETIHQFIHRILQPSFQPDCCGCF